MGKKRNYGASEDSPDACFGAPGSCLFPLATLRALVGDGVLGSLAPELLSCMGGIYSTRRVREELAPAVVAAFEEQQLDAALLVPM